MSPVKKAIYMIIYLTTHLFSLSSGPLHHTVYAIYNNLHQVHFGSDSFLIGVDNHCSPAMLPNEDHLKDLKLKQIGKCTDIDTVLNVAGIFIMNIEDNDMTVSTR